MRIQPELLGAVDKLAEALGDSRAEALRYALRTYMESDGFLPHRPRIPGHFLISLNRPYADGLKEAFGANIEDQVEGIETVVMEWLRENDHLKGGRE